VLQLQLRPEPESSKRAISSTAEAANQFLAELARQIKAGSMVSTPKTKEV